MKSLVLASCLITAALAQQQNFDKVEIQTIPVPPSIRTGRPVPLDLERVIMRCLEKDPTRRPQAADDLAAELDGMTLERPWNQTRAREWWAEHLGETVRARPAAPREMLAVG